MGATDASAPAGTTTGVDPTIVQAIEGADEGNFLVLNGDSRTWEVTDVVDRPIEEPADDRLSKRVLRLGRSN